MVWVNRCFQLIRFKLIGKYFLSLFLKTTQWSRFQLIRFKLIGKSYTLAQTAEDTADTFEVSN